MTDLPRYRYLSEWAIETYRENGWRHHTRDYDDLTNDLYDVCCREHLPFVLIIQPRRFCQIEASTSPIGGISATPPQLKLLAIQSLHQAATDAVARSSAPKRSRSVRVDADSAMIQGLDLEHAKPLAGTIAEVLRNPANYMPEAT